MRSDVTHRARNNLSADAQAGLMHLLGPGVIAHAEGAGRAAANATDEPIYECKLTAQRVSVPVRMLGRAKPTVCGTQTATVVGASGEPIHTDRDGRVKVQFHWQRGAQSSHRLSHPSADANNAPGDQTAGTWVRVAQAWAGSNWGGVFIPRVGQEVVIAFVEGDIDRPIVVEMWLYPDGARVLEVSAKCLPKEALEFGGRFKEYLAARGIVLAADQSAKTKTSLEYFSARYESDQPAAKPAAK